jgi:hypothetical protein
MSDDSKKRGLQRKISERRTSPRFQLSPPPQIEILPTDRGAPIKVRLGDLSQGGCYVETDCVLPLGTEVTVTLEKSGDHVRTQARVVRVSSNKGLALAFTSIEKMGRRILDQWLSTFIATTWSAANRRRSQRAALQIEVNVSGYNAKGAPFTEDTRTVEISAFGGSVILRIPVNKGQRLLLSNLKTKVMVECVVANLEARGTEWLVGLAFIVANQPFWPIDFPPADWSPSHPDAKRYRS